MADDTTLAPTVRERILRRLPGRRRVWILLWASVPLLSLFAAVGF